MAVPELCDDVDEKPLEHLSDHLIGAADEDLLGPVVVRRHLVEQPLAKHAHNTTNIKDNINIMVYYYSDASLQVADGFKTNLSC